ARDRRAAGGDVAREDRAERPADHDERPAPRLLRGEVEHRQRIGARKFQRYLAVAETRAAVIEGNDMQAELPEEQRRPRLRESVGDVAIVAVERDDPGGVGIG